MLTSAWKLIWNDECDGPTGSTPDPTKWQFDMGGHGWGNQELQYYTDQPENACLDGDGALVITGLKHDQPALRALNCWYGPCRFTSARLLTKGRFTMTYGRVEALIRLPYGQGIWPAFWMSGDNIDQVGWPGCGEIDIMENVGHELSTVHGSLHGPGYYGVHGITAQYSLPHGAQFNASYHLFAIEWAPETLTWFVDGYLYASISKSQFSNQRPWVFDHPFFVIINLAVGGGWPGDPDTSTFFPQRMHIDYVRVYQHP